MFSNRVLFTGMVCLFAVTASHGMSKPRHLNGAGKLGGINDLKFSVDEVRYLKKNGERISEWMDKPASQTGRYINHKAGGVKVAPSNHNALRHNPRNVGKVMSGNGTINPYARDVGRIHKIQDVFNNKVNIDGWKITAKMRRESKSILKHLKKHKRLPKKLPVWVDAEGGGIFNRSLKATEKAAALKNLNKFRTPRLGKTVNGFPISKEVIKKAEAIRRYVKRFGKLPKASRIPGFLYMEKAGTATRRVLPRISGLSSGVKSLKFVKGCVLPVVVVIQGVCFALEWSEIESRFERGEFDEFDRVALRSKCIGKTVGVAAGIAGVVVVDIFLSPLILFGGVPGIVIIGAIDIGIFYGAEFVGEKIGEFVGKRLANYLREEFKHRVVVETDYNDALNDFSVRPETLKAAGVDKAELLGYVAAYKKFFSKLKTRRRVVSAFSSQDDFFGMETIGFYNSQLGE